MIWISKLKFLGHHNKRVFCHFDGDKDNKISPAELRQRVVAVDGGDISLAEAAIGDGQLRFEDFVALVKGGSGGEGRRPEEAFKMYEIDGGERITSKRLKEMLSQLSESRSHDECRAMIAEINFNRDGVINFDEFVVTWL